MSYVFHAIMVSQILLSLGCVFKDLHILGKKNTTPPLPPPINPSGMPVSELVTLNENIYFIKLHFAKCVQPELPFCANLCMTD